MLIECDLSSLTSVENIAKRKSSIKEVINDSAEFLITQVVRIPFDVLKKRDHHSTRREQLYRYVVFTLLHKKKISREMHSQKYPFSILTFELEPRTLSTKARKNFGLVLCEKLTNWGDFCTMR